MGKTFRIYDRARDLNRLYQKIDGLTAEDLHAVAQELFRPEKLDIPHLPIALYRGP